MSHHHRIDIHDLVEATCDRLGVTASYVYRLDIQAGKDATVYLYKGRDGRCKGPKYVVDAKGVPVDGRFLSPDEKPTAAAVEVIKVPVDS